MLRFLLPSLVGILMFLTPYPTAGGVNIGIGILTDWTSARLGDSLPAIVTATVCLSALLSIYVFLARPPWAEGKSGLGRIFNVGITSVVLRVVGALLACMVLFQVGPEWIISDADGGVILNDLMTVIFVLFLYASVLLPFLTDFGLMEFIGTLARPLFKPLFRLPGRGAVDGAASWFGSSVVGIIITAQQHEEGYYTTREAAIMATTFSVVSVAFAVVVINFVNLGRYFLHFYGAIFVSGMVAAMVLPRIPPLSRVPNVRVGPEEPQNEVAPTGRGPVSWGLELAKQRAAEVPPAAAMARQSLHTTFDIWFGLEPLVMVIGTVSLALANHTPVFEWLSLPVVPLLELLRLPEAAAAAPALLVGFADQFLPVILGQSIESELTRFVIACAAVTQLIYMSEVGVLILKSRLSLNVLDLFVIFLLRTVITVPICAFLAHLIF